MRRSSSSREAARLLEGRKVSGNSALWIFTSRAVKSRGRRRATPTTIQRAGGVLLTDTCSAFAQALPPGTKVAALDSAKQVHYLPAILGIAGVVRIDTRLHQRGADRALGGRRP